ncbi:MAG: tRNA pseudouridine(55) synthase TruB [bacterium]|nr:tRNA pseudouridine(55) synthase TruB [bacterium]
MQTTRVHHPRRMLDGVLVVDKPRDWTSHDVVAKVRAHFRLHKLGHAGTLDPVATGVLVLLAGRATKCAEFLLADDKEYRFVVRCGITTDTQDITGTVLAQIENPPEPSRDTIEQVLAAFRGQILQVPPMFSAVKIDGTRLYKLGRKGRDIPREPRPITISELVLEKIHWPCITLRAVCSKGTYVRTLCHDIGQQLGVGGCMESLVRLRSGVYTLTQALPLPQVLQLTPEQFAAALLPMPVRPAPPGRPQLPG